MHLLKEHYGITNDDVGLALQYSSAKQLLADINRAVKKYGLTKTLTNDYYPSTQTLTLADVERAQVQLGYL